MEEMLTARQFALETGRPPRTVQQWAERGEVDGARKEQPIGAPREVWIATRAAWVAAAAKERKAGRPPKSRDGA